MPTFSSNNFDVYMSAFRQSFTFIVDILHNFINVIRGSPLYYMPMFLFLLLGITAVLIWLIQEVSNNANFSNSYNTQMFRYSSRMFEVNRFYDTKKFNGLFFDVNKFFKKKKQNNETKMRSDNFLADWKIADEYFNNNPNRMSVHFNGHTFFNDNWYKFRFDKQGKMKHTFVYDEFGNVKKHIKSISEYEDDDIN